jgi:hypothetical protein
MYVFAVEERRNSTTLKERRQKGNTARETERENEDVKK